MFRRILYSAITWLLFSFIPLTAFSEETPDQDTASTDTTPNASNSVHRWYFSGFASEQYRLRSANNLELLEINRTGDIVQNKVSKSESDNDLRLVLSGQIWESWDRFSADYSMALWHDLDGASTEGLPSMFVSVTEGDSSKIWRDPYDIFSLYADYHSAGVLALARGGRQTSDYGRPTTFDGATVKLALVRPYVDLVFFGGRTVHFFETSHGLFESSLASAAIVFRPLPVLRIETDYRYSAEDANIRTGIRDSSYSFAIWYQVSDIARFKAYARGLNDDISNSGGSAAFEWAHLLLGVDADIDSQLVTLQQINESDNPYFEVLGQSLPYLRLKVDIWKKLATRFGIYGAELGWQQRMVVDRRSTQFNRNFGRTYLRLEATDIGAEGPFADCVIEYNYTFSNPGFAQNSLVTIGGSAGYDRKPIKATVGSYYYQYKYDYYVDVRELANVRGYFGEFRYDPFKWLSGRVNYTFEQFDRNIHTVTLTLVETY